MVEQLYVGPYYIVREDQSELSRTRTNARSEMANRGRLASPCLNMKIQS